MKRLLFMLMAVACIAGIGRAKDTYSHDASVLPEAARTVIASNFKAKVSVVKIEREAGRVSEYEVVLTDGTEISFDSSGIWDNVEVNNSKSVPASIVPKAIRNFVAKHHRGQRIVGIDKEREGYEVELSNGVEIKFDKAGNFNGYDN